MILARLVCFKMVCFKMVCFTMVCFTLVCFSGCGAPAPIAAPYRLEHTYSVHDPQFLRVMGHLLGPPAMEGNTVTTLVNGDEIFPAMLEAIRQAKASITFETFIYWSGDIGKAFAEAFAERARAGVKVHLMIDAVGGDDIDPNYIAMMEEAGVHVVRYNPIEKLLLLVTASQVNHRTHRKLLVIDGRIGFIGGVGIADVWDGDAQDPQRWRDNHYRVEGPVVASLQAAFVDNWIQAVGQVLDGEAYFPHLQKVGHMYGQVFMSSPEGGSASMELMYLLSINAATESVYLASAYFVPNDLLLDALAKARQRGVEVTVILPGPHMDMKLAGAASRALYDELLAIGVKIYEYQPTMFHCKLMVVDRVWTSVGSANLDPRSFRLNDEANLNVYDAGFAQRQIEILAEDITRSKRIEESEYENRSLLDRIGEFFGTMLSPQL